MENTPSPETHPEILSVKVYDLNGVLDSLESILSVEPKWLPNRAEQTNPIKSKLVGASPNSVVNFNDSNGKLITSVLVRRNGLYEILP